MGWQLEKDRPIYVQLVEGLQSRIVSGQYPPGSKVASVRELAAEAAVNPNTMQKALTELERSGLVYAQRTSGRFITEDTNIMKELKEHLAKEQIQLFLTHMKQLGFQKEDIIRLLTQEIKEEI